MRLRILLLSITLTTAPAAYAQDELLCSAILTGRGLAANDQEFGAVIRELVKPYRHVALKMTWWPRGVLPGGAVDLRNAKPTTIDVPRLTDAQYAEAPLLEVQVFAISREAHDIRWSRAYEFSSNTTPAAMARGGARTYLTFETEYDVVPDRLKLLALYAAMTSAPQARALRVRVEVDPASAPTPTRRETLEERLATMRRLEQGSRMLTSDIAIVVRPRLVRALESKNALAPFEQAYVFPRTWKVAATIPSLKDADLVHLEYWFHTPAARRTE